MINLTNRFLAEKLSINFQRWKRLSRAFLPPDMITSLPKGKARKYALNEAFTVHLGGHLIDLGFSIIEARQILGDLFPWITEKGQWPDRQGYKPRGLDQHINRYLISIIPVKIWLKPGEGDKSVYPFESYEETEKWCSSHESRFGFRYIIKGEIAQRPVMYEGYEVSSEIFCIEKIDPYGRQVPQIPRLNGRLQVEAIEVRAKSRETTKEFYKDDKTKLTKVLDIGSLRFDFELSLKGQEIWMKEFKGE